MQLFNNYLNNNDNLSILETGTGLAFIGSNFMTKVAFKFDAYENYIGNRYS